MNDMHDASSIAALLPSLVVGSFVGAAAGYLGSLMISKRMALVGDALGHVALPGMGIALLLHLDVTLGAFLFLGLGILLIWLLESKTALSLETLAGIVFVSSLAIGFLIVPEPDLLESLIGDISKLTSAGSMFSIVLSIATILLIRKIYPGMTLASISPELASVEGFSVRKYNLIYLFTVALIVAIGIRVTGSLLVGALVILPPATARVMSRNLKQYALLSALVGIASNILGIVASKFFHVPAGPSIILVNAFIFAVSSIFQ